MGRFAASFRQVGSAKDMTTFEPPLPAGNHLVALVSFLGKENRDKSVRVEAEFVILETDSTATEPGTLHSWSWPIGTSGDVGTYAQDRNKKFLKVVAQSAGIDASTEEELGNFGDSMDEEFRTTEPNLYGLQLKVKVTPAIKGGRPIIGKRGEVFNADFSYVAQDDSDIESTRATLKDIGFRPKFLSNPASGAKEPEAEKSVAEAPKVSGLKKLGLKK